VVALSAPGPIWTVNPTKQTLIGHCRATVGLGMLH
jgi:hypothetical protein